MGTHRQGSVANGKLTQYISPKSSSHDHALTHGNLCTHSQVINTIGLHNDYTFHTGLQTQHYNINFGLKELISEMKGSVEKGDKHLNSPKTSKVKKVFCWLTRH